ncbi:MAG TPA: membrane dipeptidase [Steroidobacteraceae bacterium]|nr:membrane dipeptidase [Steroidobacteraceae bacterium]
MSRRRFVQLAGAAALLGRASAAPRGYGADAYEHAMVIDALGGPGDNDPGAPENAPLSAHAVADARASGVTAANLTVNAVGNGLHRFEETVAGIARADLEIQRHPEAFAKVLTGADLRLAKSTRRLGLIYGFQDTSMLEGDLGRLALFQGLGVRIVQPTYNRRNLMGDGCIEPGDAGLSGLGHELVAELNSRRMLLDLSHGGPRTIAEGIAASKVPMAITHTGCRALVDSPRNVDDATLRALADKGGVVGIYFMCFLRLLEQPHAQDLIRHLEHAVDVCGEDHVGLGTDGSISAIDLNDAFKAAHRKVVEERIKQGVSAVGESPVVYNLIPEYNDPRRFLSLARDLSARGWPSSRIDKILGANFARLFTDTWGS